MKAQLNLATLPRHIAVIMDGNGRWARKQGLKRYLGHQNAIKAVREITEGAAELGISYLTLYAFSSENWNRPSHEIQALMHLLETTCYQELPTLQKNNIRLAVIGNLSRLPLACQKAVEHAIIETASNTHMQLTIALSYGARDDITEAARKIVLACLAQQINPQDITPSLFARFLSTASLPEPELLIRTSGEMRISNFLLWELAYAELYFTDKLWPDFRKEDLYEAIYEFQKRERRFGKTSEQISEEKLQSTTPNTLS
ncbi:MAG: isoprenyl transferase [Bacteroidia bacterium]|nr:isoprenyl transferase [Bacteroidia bacterium]MDW8159418.1 isoprenyl transferase [Bacteroidia bacterium]